MDKDTRKMFINWNAHIYGNGSVANVSREITKALCNLDVPLGITNVSKRKSKNQYISEEENKFFDRLVNKNSDDSERRVNIRFARLQEYELFESTIYNGEINILALALPYSLTFPSLTPKVIGKKYNLLWANSKFVKESLVELGVCEDIIKVIPHGVNTSIFHPSVKPYRFETNKKFKFLNVSIPLLLTKGLDLLIEAYCEEFDSNDNVSLVLISRYSNKDIISKYIYETQKRLNRYPEIQLIEAHKSSQELASIYRACNCYVQPSRCEAFGLPVLESMACGLPNIVTSVGGMIDYTNDTFTKYIDCDLVPCSDRGKDELNNSLIRYWANPSKSDLMEKMRETYESNAIKLEEEGILASKHASENYNWNKVAQLALESIKELGVHNS